jgi:hypothetical protein
MTATTVEAQIALMLQRVVMLGERTAQLERMRAEDDRDTNNRNVIWTQAMAEVRNHLSGLSSEVAQLRSALIGMQRRSNALGTEDTHA